MLCDVSHSPDADQIFLYKTALFAKCTALTNGLAVMFKMIQYIIK